MSTEFSENLVHIERIDVNATIDENEILYNIKSNSGVTETINSTFPALPKYELDIDKQCLRRDNDETTVDVDDIVKFGLLPSSLDGNDDTDVSIGSCEQSGLIESYNDVSFDEIDHNVSEINEMPEFMNNTLSPGKNTLPLHLNLENTLNKSLANSTVSLNRTNSIDSNQSINVTTFSKSADNISVTENVSNKDVDSKEINAEQILSEFAAHKVKANAVQKVLPITSTSIDVRYSRIPKELLSQDIGSIVKNVHGIFSTVSGSLKNAYTNSQRVTTSRSTKVTTPIPNSKVMCDIFEDDVKSSETVDNIDKVKNVELSPEKETSQVTEQGDDTDPKKDLLRMQIETLERILAEQRRENAGLRDRVKQQSDDMLQKVLMFKELETKMDLMGKRVEQAEREKDAAVMRYASVECAKIEAKRAAETSAKAEKAAIAEMELLSNKLKSAHSEKQRICQLYDDKCHELLNTERDFAKMREELRELEGRLKWTQSKLRAEMDSYKESVDRAEKLTQQLAEAEAAKEVAIANAADQTRTKQLEAELKEACASMILCRHEKEELEKQLSTVTQQLDSCTKEKDEAVSRLTVLEAEVLKLKSNNESLEAEAAELAGLRAQAALATSLSARVEAAERTATAERARADASARREETALRHVADVTALEVELRAQVRISDDKARALSSENSSLRERVTSLQTDCAGLQSSLKEETERRHRENKTLARKVAELTEEVAEVSKKLEWEKGENNVLKKKHSNAVKELNRELQRALKRCEQLEAKLPQNDAPSTRTGSVSSLSSGESAPHDDNVQNGHSEQLPDIQVREPDRQALIERIVSLQRAAARRSERCEFLEEHSKQLTGELRAKSRLLRHLLSTMPAGSMATHDRDNNKRKKLTKKEIARLGGSAMAALWGGDSTGMTLELSLEMNTRLQALLEDTLLKNITLKENMDTLGEEISRLKKQKSTENK